MPYATRSNAAALMTAPSAPRTEVRAAVQGVGSWLPERVMTSEEVERRLVLEGAPETPVMRAGMIARRSGVRERRIIAPGDDVSDLAARAARSAIEEAGCSVSDIDLVLFASGSQDLIEPATGHLVCEKLGATATTFDIKNACNSFLNGVQVANAFIRAGQHERVLVCTGEAPSMAVRWSLSDRSHFRESFVGYTLGDAGAAIVLDARSDGTGIEHIEFRSASRHWRACTLDAGGSRHWRDLDRSYFRSDGSALRDVFLSWGPGVFEEMMARAGTRHEDFDVVLAHQVTAPLFDAFLEATGIPESKTVPIVGRLGNIASASLPVQFDVARRSLGLGPGTRVMFIGLGAGISLGLATLQL